MWYKNVGCCVGCYHMSFRSNELARYLFCPSEMNHVNTQTTDRRINKFITHGQRGLDDDRLLLSLNFSPRILKSRHQSSVHLTPFFLSSLTLIGKTLILIVYLYTTQDNFCNSTDILLDCDTTQKYMDPSAHFCMDRIAVQQAISTRIFMSLFHTLFCKS